MHARQAGVRAVRWAGGEEGGRALVLPVEGTWHGRA
jgi:hypothetical protein